MCGVAVQLEGEHILSVRGDPQDLFSRGHICPKALALKDIHEDPDRLRRPMRRTPSGWQEISWDEALDEAAERLIAIQREHGSDAVASYMGNPQVHSYTGLLGGVQLLRALRSRNRYSATSVDQLPHHMASYFLYGHQLLIPVPDVDRTDFMLIIGGNPVVSNGSLMTAPDIANRLREVRGRGGRLVVIDPRRSETAALANQYVAIRPGTDVLLLLGMLHTIFDEDLLERERLPSFIDQLAEVQAISLEFSPEQTASITTVDSKILRQLTRDFVASPSAVCYGRMGVSTQQFGAVCQWLIQLINILTGNLDRPGGAMFPEPAFDMLKLGGGFGQRGSYGKRVTRVRGLPEFGGEFPVAALAEEILTPGPGQIRALVTAAGNPVLSTPNGQQLEAALSSLEFMVSVDIYLNETTRHAHLILPPTFGLERDHFDLVFHGLAIRNTVKYALPAVEVAKTARHDWQIFQGLVERLETLDPARRPAWRERMLRRWLTPRRLIALGIRRGRRGAGASWRVGRSAPSDHGLTLSQIIRSVHGVDLGALEPALPGRLQTATKRIHLVPEVFAKDIARVRRIFFERDDHFSALQLIGRRDLRSNNSWGHNSYRLVKGPRRCTLRMHPKDASARALHDGEIVQIRSRVGVLKAVLQVTDELLPGVVSLPHGWGHDRPSIKLSVAAGQPGISVNDLTDDQFIDQLSGNAALNGIAVSVEPLGVN
jgi:anaerobic selenocysteine-containing dehydrogenase